MRVESAHVEMPLFSSSVLLFCSYSDKLRTFPDEEMMLNSMLVSLPFSIERITEPDHPYESLPFTGGQKLSEQKCSCFTLGQWVGKNPNRKMGRSPNRRRLTATDPTEPKMRGSSLSHSEHLPKETLCPMSSPLPSTSYVWMRFWMARRPQRRGSRGLRSR